ncbi:hypothetical protein MBLNU13_g11248t1 [Cladosporium sp. NU13]
MNVSTIAENSQFDIKNTYETLITAMSDKLVRRDRWSVSTLEVIISNRDHSFHEVWKNDVTRMPVCWQEHDPVQYSYDFDRAIERISGRRWGLKGGSEWVDVTSKLSLIALGAFHAYVASWNTRINERNSITAREAFEETKRKNAVDETIAVQNAETARLSAVTAREALEETKRKNAFDEAMQLAKLISHESPVLQVYQNYLRQSAACRSEPSPEIPAYTALRQKHTAQASILQASLSNAGSTSAQAEPVRQTRAALPDNNDDPRYLAANQRSPPRSLVGSVMSATGLPQRPRPPQQRASDVEQGMAPPNTRYPPSSNNGPGVSVAPATNRIPPNRTSSSDQCAPNAGQSTSKSVMPRDPIRPLQQYSGDQVYRRRVQSTPTPGQQRPGAGYPLPQRDFDRVPTLFSPVRAPEAATSPQ